MAHSDFPANIDRFLVNDILGKGAQGVVYKATDPSLDRLVAIKSVFVQGNFLQLENIDNLFQEARTVSQLQHSNIVSIYDVSEDPLNPYLVLEYIDGESLQTRLQDTQQVPLQTAFKIIRDVLAGVAAAHSEGIIHCDLKPANIMITRQGQAKVADFGLALLAEHQQNNEQLKGTPEYMAPEYLETHQHKTVSDVFSLGLIFYEMLAGKKAVEGENIYQLLHAMANRPILPPSRHNKNVDETLDALIMKALEIDPDNRYPSAAEMLNSFENNLALNDTINLIDASNSTVKFLLRRMSHKKDFPAFSETIAILNRASNSTTESMDIASNAILKDTALTNMVLRVVNSTQYNRGSPITTVSRAVVMMGINAIKSLSISLLLFNHLQKENQSEQLQEDAITSLFCAILATGLARFNHIREHEEAFLCALLQQLGKLLVRYYLYEESVAIDTQMEQKNLLENTAALVILGTSFHAIGMDVAKDWEFPRQIVDSMEPVSDILLKSRSSRIPKLRLISSFSNALGNLLKKPASEHEERLEKLIEQYSSTLNINGSRVRSLIHEATRELAEFGIMLNLKLSSSRFYHQLIAYQGGPEKQHRTQPIPKLSGLSSNASFDKAQQLAQSESLNILIKGIQEVTDTLGEEGSSPRLILKMILETIYRALPGTRVLLALRDKTSHCYLGKYGYGRHIQNLKENFALPLQYEADLFHIALKSNADIRIDDTANSKIKSKLPDWYLQKINARSFLLFPVVATQNPLALIYVDSSNPKQIALSEDQLMLFKTLRNQAILAIKYLR